MIVFLFIVRQSDIHFISELKNKPKKKRKQRKRKKKQNKTKPKNKTAATDTINVQLSIWNLDFLF